MRRFPLLPALVLLLALLVPLLWALVSSFRPEAALFGAAPDEFDLGLDHYRALFSERGFLRPIFNSVFVAATTTLISISLGALCAYALARLEFPFKRVLIASVLAIAMFPQISILSPLYLLLRKLGLIDTYPGLILPYLTFSMPLSVWLLVTHFRKLPYGIEEAALLDGAGRLRTLVEVVLPSTLPGILTTAAVTFVYCYNEFLFAFAFTLGPEHQTVPVAIALLRGRYQVPWGQVLAAAMVASLPVLVLVLAFQRRIVQGFSR